jgi:hypothetical protein
MSRFHSAGQDGFTDTKEDLADEIRAWVRKRVAGMAELRTLERMSLTTCPRSCTPSAIQSKRPRSMPRWEVKP